MLKGHLQDQMEQKIVQLHIRLLTIELTHLQKDPSLALRHLHLFPNLENAVQLDPYAQQQVLIGKSQTVPVTDGLAIADSTVLDTYRSTGTQPTQFDPQI